MERVPQRFYMDRRADQLVEECNGNDDDLLSTKEVASWLGCSPQWLEVGRFRGYGPKFCRLNPKRIRYRRGDIRAWLSERCHSSTAEYSRRQRQRLDELADA